MCFGIKLVQIILSVKHIACTSKRMEVRDVGLSISPQFIGSLIQNRSYRNPILNITCCVYCFCPKIFSHICLIDHGSGHFLQGSIFPLYNSILLWSSRTGEIMQNAIFRKIFFEKFVFKFTTMITSDFDYFKIFFILNLITEVSKHRVRLILVF